MTDEKYCFITDCKEKRSIAASSHKQRTHCGKGGRAKLPHEKLTKKELMKLNSEIREYKMNEPISWKEFKEMPDDLKKEYIENLRKKFNVPDKYIAEMMGISSRTFVLYMKDLGLNKGSNTSASIRKWDQSGFEKWTNDDVLKEVKEPEKPCDIVIETVSGPKTAGEIIDSLKVNKPPVGPRGEYDPPEVWNIPKLATPSRGSLSFDNNDIYEIFEAIKPLICRRSINAVFTWDVVE